MGTTNLSDSTMRKLAYIFPGLSLLFTWWLPAGLQWSFFISTILSQLQGRLLRWVPFRQFMGITPLPKRADPSNTIVSRQSPYQPRIITVADKNATMTHGTPPSQSKPTLFSGLRKEISGAVEKAKSAKDSIKALAREESKNGKRTKAELQTANAYEEKRRREESKRLAAINAERRARRLQKRQQQG
jgi:YidC/Oxa1 family membrane protein insertase